MASFPIRRRPTGRSLCVFVFDRHIVAFAFRKEKEKTAHSGDDGQRNRLPNPQAGVLPVTEDGGYLRIRQAKVSCFCRLLCPVRS